MAVQIDRRRVEAAGNIHPFLQRSEQIGDRVAPGFRAKLLQHRLQSLLARLLGDEARPFEKLGCPLCSRTVEIALRLPEPVAASLGHGPSYVLRGAPPTGHGPPRPSAARRCGGANRLVAARWQISSWRRGGVHFFYVVADQRKPSRCICAMW